MKLNVKDKPLNSDLQLQLTFKSEDFSLQSTTNFNTLGTIHTHVVYVE